MPDPWDNAPRQTGGISANGLMLKQFEPLKHVVARYLVEGLTVFAGAPKLGKSWLALDWAHAVSTGALAFGTVACEHGDVLYLALEDNQRRLQSRLRHMRVTDASERLTFHTEWPDMEGDCIPRIQSWIDGAIAPRLVIVDVFAKVRGFNTGRETQYEADYRFASKLQRLAIENNIAIVLIHHTRKQEADDPFDTVSGTTGLTGAADSVLVLRRDVGSQRTILYGRGRDLEEVETALKFDSEHGRWRILGDAGEIAKTHERRAITELLGRSVDPMSPTEIADALGKTRSNVSHLLSRLMAETLVQKHEKGRYSLIPPIHSVHSVHSDSERSERSDRGVAPRITQPFQIEDPADTYFGGHA